MADCSINKKYPGIKCPRPPWDDDGLCLLHSRREDKDQDGEFTQEIKTKLGKEDYDFAGIFFPGPVDFQQQAFTKKADFSYAIFSQQANFFDTMFSHEADFSLVNFFQEAIFFRAKFSEEANFFQATFSEGVDFYQAAFYKKAIFLRAKFSQESHFSLATFYQEADFLRATFSARAMVSFTTVNPPEQDGQRPPFRGDFCFLNLQASSHSQILLLFYDIPLSKVRFSGADLRQIDFHRVTWPRHKWRDAVYDEILLRKKGGEGEYHDVERLYRYLKLSYEAKGDLKQAGRWHYGEMEMHRRASSWRRGFWFSFYNLYKWLSGYGEQPGLAAFWIFAFMAGLAVLLQWAGLEVTGHALKHRADFWESLVFVLQKVTFQRPDWASTPTLSGKVLSSLSAVIIPGQAALFLLALRNRLGRRR